MSGRAPVWEVGDALEGRELPPVDRMKLIRYSGASGDYNPIHTIDAEAERAGLPGVIQHGMLTMAELGSLFSPFLAHGYVRRFSTRFRGMVGLNERLRLEGRVGGVEEIAEGRLYSFELSAVDSAGRPVAAGEADFLVFGGGG